MNNIIRDCYQCCGHSCTLVRYGGEEVEATLKLFFKTYTSKSLAYHAKYRHCHTVIKLEQSYVVKTLAKINIFEVEDNIKLLRIQRKFPKTIHIVLEAKHGFYEKSVVVSVSTKRGDCCFIGIWKEWGPRSYQTKFSPL